MTLNVMRPTPDLGGPHLSIVESYEVTRANVQATVGPPLTQIARRQYLGGHIINTPDNMMKWLQHPQQIDPKNAMPEMGVTDQDARDIAAYLYTLR